MSSLIQSEKNALAFKLLKQLTILADGATFTKRMRVLRDIKEAWEKNKEVAVITEDSSFVDSEQASLNTAEGEPGPQLGPNSNLGSMAGEPECSGGPLDKGRLFEDLGNNRGQVTLTKTSLTGSLQAEQDKSPGGDTGWDAIQDFSPHQRLVEEDASADGKDSTGDIPIQQGGGKPRAFECETCRRSFKFGEFSAKRPFHCPHCQPSPAEQGGLNGASQTIKPSTNSSPKSKASATSHQPFPCDFCPSRFKRKAHLMAHIETHNGDKQFPCAFSTTTERNSHTKSHLMPNVTSDKKQAKSSNHSSQKGNATRASTLKAPRRSMAASTGIQKKYEHFRVNKKVLKGFKCSICPRVCFTLKGIQKHTENHRQPHKKVIKKSFQCKSCLKHFASSTNLKRHIFEVCSKAASKKQPASRIRKVNKKMPTLTGHSQLTLLTPIKKNVPKETPANREKVSQKVKVFKCQYCGKQMTNRAHWEEHERVHTGERPFGCSICDVWFKRKSVGNKHMKDMHQGMIDELKEKNTRVPGQKEKKPSEHLGLKAQASKASLTRKVTPASGIANRPMLNQSRAPLRKNPNQGSNTSSTEASKKAPFAKKSLSPGASTSQSKIAAAANHHSPTVTSVKSPSKQASQQKSPSTSYLSSPTSHRGQKAEMFQNLNPHQSRISSKAFTSAEKLAFYEKSHIKHSLKSPDSPSVPGTSRDQDKLYVECSFCGKVYKRHDQVVEHERQHTGERPLLCKCGKAFARKSILRKHERFHCALSEETGPTPI